MIVFQSESLWKELVDYERPNDAYIMLLHGDGRVEWHDHGAFRDEDYFMPQQRVRALLSREATLLKPDF